jgi:homoserine kinase
VKKSSSVPLSVRVRVPATSANLGPGFDALGLAVGLYDEIRVRFGSPDQRSPLRVTAEGMGGSDIPTDATNLAYRAMGRLFQAAGKSMPSVEIHLTVRLPVAGGLGSSSAAIVGGLIAANTAMKGFFSMDDLIEMATALEGHPDNVLPALVGGLCAGIVTPNGVKYVAWKDAYLTRDLRAVVCTPNLKVPTERARRVLPARVDRKDAVYNAAHVALFLSALKEKRYDLLGEAMGDRLHQPYRAALVPGLMDVIAGARAGGAYGAALSGAGPTVLALTSKEKASNVARAMERVFREKGSPSLSRVLSLELQGARLF